MHGSLPRHRRRRCSHSTRTSLPTCLRGLQALKTTNPIFDPRPGLQSTQKLLQPRVSAVAKQGLPPSSSSRTMPRFRACVPLHQGSQTVHALQSPYLKEADCNAASVLQPVFDSQDRLVLCPGGHECAEESYAVGIHPLANCRTRGWQSLGQAPGLQRSICRVSTWNMLFDGPHRNSETSLSMPHLLASGATSDL